MIQIADFGLSRELPTDHGEYYTSAVGMVPLRWTAPEALLQRHFSTASDVWSFAVFCGEVFDNGARVGRRIVLRFLPLHCRLTPILHGPQPYDHLLNEQVWLHIEAGKGLPRPAKCPSDVYKSVFLPCFNIVPDLRPSFTVLKDVLGVLADEEEEKVMPSSSTLDLNVARPTPLDGLEGLASLTQLAPMSDAAAAAAATQSTSPSPVMPLRGLKEAVEPADGAFSPTRSHVFERFHFGSDRSAGGGLQANTIAHKQGFLGSPGPSAVHTAQEHGLAADQDFYSPFAGSLVAPIGGELSDGFTTDIAPEAESPFTSEVAPIPSPVRRAAESSSSSSLYTMRQPVITLVNPVLMGNGFTPVALGAPMGAGVAESLESPPATSQIGSVARSPGVCITISEHILSSCVEV